MGIDLSIIWFVIIVFATLMYIVMDGFDLGIGILFPATQNADAVKQLAGEMQRTLARAGRVA